MNPFAFTCRVLGVLGALFLMVSEVAAASRPNILVILTDDQRWDAMSCAGNQLFSTPNIDRLAKEGARFKNVFVTTSLCSPSRATMLSGRYARQHGVMNNFTEYPVNLPSYPRSLHEAGYETAYIGKWHMGEDNDEKRPGFDHWYSHRGQGNYFDNEFNDDGVRKKVPGYYTTTVTTHAIDWLKQKRDKPFLLVIGQKAPHGGPIQPEPRFEHALDKVPVPRPKNADDYAAPDKPSWLKESYPTWHGGGGPLYDLKTLDNLVRTYLETILSVDESVGHIYDTLKSMGHLDHTVILFTSDNGFVLGEHGRTDKRTMYEESLRIPLIVRYPPSVKPGTVIDQMVTSLDIAPSIVDFGGGKRLKGIDGLSFKPLLEGKRVKWRDAFLYEYNFEKQFPYTPNIRGIRTDEWKLIRYPHGDGGPDRFTAELYHLTDDPLEQKNLINDPRWASQRKQLERDLEKLSKHIGPDKMPVYEGITDVRPKY